MEPFAIAFTLMWGRISPPHYASPPRAVVTAAARPAPTTTTTVSPYAGLDNGVRQTPEQTTGPVYVVLYGYCAVVDSHTYAGMVAAGQTMTPCQASEVGQAAK